jgi:acetyl-CoA carboxylase biotin carboxyl carrier protein
MAHTLSAEMVASVHSIEVSTGQRVDPGAVIVVLESMKMEIPVLAETGGIVIDIFVAAGDVVREGDALAIIE